MIIDIDTAEKHHQEEINKEMVSNYHNIVIMDIRDSLSYYVLVLYIYNDECFTYYECKQLRTSTPLYISSLLASKKTG